MRRRQFTDPFGSKLPALELNILKLRAMEMVLVLFYAEELKRHVVDCIQTTDRLSNNLQKNVKQRIPKGTKNPVDKALSALVDDKVIRADEKKEIVGLIDYRNAIGHQIHDLLLDLSPERMARDIIAFRDNKLPKYDYRAAERLQYFLKLLSKRTRRYVHTMNFNLYFFEAAERIFKSDIKIRKHKIDSLLEIRQGQIKALNLEMSLEGTELVGEYDPRHPLSHYDDKRLTKRGAEICYRLFDLGKSTMAVAHLHGISLRAAIKRRRSWMALGGSNRPKIDIDAIPHRKFYRRDDD
jgi:hypothetical protein